MQCYCFVFSVGFCHFLFLRLPLRIGAGGIVFRGHPLRTSAKYQPKLTPFPLVHFCSHCLNPSPSPLRTSAPGLRVLDARCMQSTGCCACLLLSCLCTNHASSVNEFDASAVSRQGREISSHSSTVSAMKAQNRLLRPWYN